MSEPFLGEIRIFGFNFAPRGWGLCNGQLLPISQNTALFSLLGTMYGGNGQTTFALPNLQGRFPMHFGQGPGLSNRDQGEVSGSETVTLTQNQMPSHNHTVAASNAGADGTRPAGKFLSGGGSYTSASDGSVMNPAMIGASGGSQPVGVMPPYLVLNFCIAMEGIFPSRQ